jgi:hypothetical protein
MGQSRKSPDGLINSRDQFAQQRLRLLQITCVSPTSRKAKLAVRVCCAAGRSTRPRSIQRFDEWREGDLSFAFGRPRADKLVALPLNGNQRDEPRSVFQDISESIVAAAELDATQGSHVVGRFERDYKLRRGRGNHHGHGNTLFHNNRFVFPQRRHRLPV